MITSTDNKRLKNISLLLKKASARKQQSLFIAEGERLLFETPSDLIDSVFAAESFAAKPENEEKLKKLCPEYEVVKDEVFNKIADTVTPQGVLGVIRQPGWNLGELLSNEKNDFILILNGVQDPGNLGTMMRTAEGAGVSFVLADKNTVDLFNPKVVRATMGSIFRLPFVVTEDLKGALGALKNRGVITYAAHLKGERSYFECDYKRPTAFIIGNEGNGIEDEIANAAGELIKIPMGGKLESLNAAMSAGILMYEVLRQRS
ncbi:MAG: RNA methyltransferase [Lachnospiraceae bacterium]|nr:RNA methyltransferase [Lachnospiraceae bacterium]